ncbi:hypothetical protein GCM10012286_07330 [Streptomyces lasiicapitis]|uniref:Uncharacterized protein n=1 Tax=Streptomyces lasiicapitis TaxID=1923961 RepID=A0ABQ2LIY8_9ACTN|nr:hypothetical protein GCM10012286_07330 [Streptomyces lasiicapitis]
MLRHRTAVEKGQPPHSGRFRDVPVRELGFRIVEWDDGGTLTRGPRGVRRGTLCPKCSCALPFRELTSRLGASLWVVQAGWCWEIRPGGSQVRTG